MAALLFILSWFLAGAPGLPEIRGYDLANKKVEPIKLPKELSEASGLAFATNGNLLCHNDEKGIVYELDYRTGNIRKRFSLGNFRLIATTSKGLRRKATRFLW
jgi:hypothetical protein